MKFNRRDIVTRECHLDGWPFAKSEAVTVSFCNADRVEFFGIEGSYSPDNFELAQPEKKMRRLYITLCTHNEDNSGWFSGDCDSSAEHIMKGDHGEFTYSAPYYIDIPEELWPSKNPEPQKLDGKILPVTSNGKEADHE